MNAHRPEFLGMPYAFRPPTWRRARLRLWNRGGPMFSPHIWGWGYTLNFAHAGTWVTILGLAAFALGAV